MPSALGLVLLDFVQMGGGALCLRIGVQEDIFVSDHIQAFGKQKNLQLG